ncbi:MAG: DM13 domain-containing protein [Maricaulaceae bacterium]
MLNQKKIITLLGTAAIALTLTACSSGQTNDVNVKVPTAVERVATDVQTLTKGSFSGRSDHITTGQVTLEKTASGYQLRFATNFSLDGAPDPVVAIGNDETYSVANKLGVLKNKTGAQVYQLPASFTPGQFSQVYVWCEQFSVPLGVADLA